MESRSKIVLVTGGSRGLGKDMVLSIAKKGLDVILTYNSKEQEAHDVVRQIEELGQKAHALKLNVSLINTFDQFFIDVKNVLQEKFNTGNIDFIVNNAGIGLNKPFAETTEEQLDLLINIHYKGPYLLTQKALSILNDGGGIINISSGLARFAFPGNSAYGAMKGAMEVLTRYQAKELGARGIRSNIVAPGAIETDFGGGVVRDNKDVNNFVSSVTALGRPGLPEEIGGIIAFLCTDEARWINGQRIEVSGGMML